MPDLLPVTLAEQIAEVEREIAENCDNGIGTCRFGKLCACNSDARAALAAIWPDVERREAKLKEALDDLRMHAFIGNGVVSISATEWEQT